MKLTPSQKRHIAMLEADGQFIESWTDTVKAPRNRNQWDINAGGYVSRSNEYRSSKDYNITTMYRLWHTVGAVERTAVVVGHIPNGFAGNVGATETTTITWTLK